MTEPMPTTGRAMPMAANAIDEIGAAIARNWGWVAVRGGLGIAIGLFTLFQPQTTIKALVLLFAVYSIIDGITALVAAFRAVQRDQSWGWLLVQGIISLAAAAVALLMPQLAVKVFLFVMSFWAMLGGIALLVAGFKLPTDHGRWWFIIGGALSVLWGVLLIAQPATAAVVLALWFGVYTLVFGIVFTAIAFMLRSRHKARTAG
jgi:uncharacterized membrane protein HdeD (DUF308 family)